MIKTNDLTIQTLGERFNALPGKLRDAIQSEENLRTIISACKNNILTDEEKIQAVEQIVALVILGFIPLDALAREIDENLHLNNLKLASAIANEINNKVFAGIKKEIEANYNPPKDEDDKELMAIIEESIAAGVTSVPPAPPVVSPSTTLGTSRAEPPVVSEIEPSPWTGAMKAPPSLGPLMPITPKPQAPLTPNPASKEPAPKILQEEASFGKPLRQASGFSLNIPMPKSLDANKETAPMKPAMLELGSQPSTTTPSPKAMNGAVRVVHYTELKTPLEQVGSRLIEKNAAAVASPTQMNREVKEITGSTGSPQAGQPPSSLYGNSKFDRPATPPPPPMPPSAANRIEPPVVSRVEPKMNDVVFGKPLDSARDKPLTPPAIPPRPAQGTPPLPKPPIPPSRS